MSVSIKMVNEDYPPTVFFFGSGASVDAGVSTAVGLVNDFKELLKKESDPLIQESVEEILCLLKKWKQERNDHTDVDIELLLEAIEKIENREKDILTQFF